MQTMKNTVSNSKSRFFVSAVMFDLDGTLIDSINVYYKVVETVFEKLDLPPVSRDSAAGFAGPDLCRRG